MNHEAEQKSFFCLSLVIETKIKMFGLPFRDFLSFFFFKKNFSLKINKSKFKKKKSKNAGVAPLSSSQLGTSGLRGIQGQNLL